MNDLVITPEQARQAIDAERKSRVDACGKAIQAALTEYRCVLDATVIVSTRGVTPQIAIVPQD